jgi:hypothetical protein
VLAGLFVDPHQLALRGFIERVKRHPAPREGDGRFGSACFELAAHECFKRIGEIALHVFRLEENPFVEAGRVLQIEPGQEVIAIQLDGFLQPGLLGRA